MMTLCLACVNAAGANNPTSSRSTRQFLTARNRTANLVSMNTLHPLFFACVPKTEVKGSRSGSGREFSEPPLHLGILYEYQRKGVAKGTICKYLKREGKKSGLG